MANNTTVRDAADQTVVIATTEATGVHTQHTIVTAQPALDALTDSVTVSGTVTATGPLTDTELRATPVPVSGTVSVAEPVTVDATALDVRALTSADVVTVTGGAGQAADVKVSLDGESVAVTGTFYQATQPVSGPVTDAQLRAADVKVSLDGEAVAVTGTFWQATQPVSGTFYQATQPVSLAAAVAVTDNNGALTVDNGGTFAVQATAVTPHPGRASLKSGATAAIDSTTSTQVIAGTASNYLYITAVSVYNSTSTADTYVKLQDGSGGTTLFNLPAPKLSGATIAFPTPLLVPTSGNGLFAAPAADSDAIFVSAVGFIATT